MLVLAGVAAIALTPCASLAQEQSGAGSPSPPQDPGQTLQLAGHGAALAGTYEIDTSIPEAPGFAVIGLSPTDVIDPGAGRVTFAGLVNFLDQHSDLKQGLALGGSPYWWLRRPTLEAYRDRNSWPERVLARTEISLGYAPGGDGAPNRIGAGFKTELLDRADYRLDPKFYNCVTTAYKTGFGQGDAHAIGLDPAALNQILDQAAQEWAKPAGQRDTLSDDELASEQAHADRDAWTNRWVRIKEQQTVQALVTLPASSDYLDDVKSCQNEHFAGRASWTLAGGMALRHQNGSTDSDGGSIWTSYRLPLRLGVVAPVPNYVTVFGRYDFDKTPDVASAPTIAQRFDKGVVALVVGYEAKAWKFSGQVGYESVDYRGTGPLTDESYGFYSVSYNYRLSDNVWLELLAGQKNDQLSKANGTDSYLLFNVHWAPNLVTGANH